VRLIGHPVLLVMQGLLILVYAAATAGFAARAGRRGDRLLRGFAIACLLAAFARVNYFLFPSIYSEWVYTGDVLRLAQYLVILGAIVVELLEYQRRASVAAVLDERRRVARELHDGLAQELAFIRGSASRIERGHGIDAGRVRELIAAADRALEESRSAIAALRRPVDEPLLESLLRSAESVALRAGARVRAIGDDRCKVDVERRHALQRIVREATGNATRHGGAHEVVVGVECGDTVRVSVSDDGSGFDRDAELRPDAFGLAGMRDRAEALGGRLEVRSRPGEGTTVEVVLP
jgi:signal transduction histidine kinase